MTEKLNHLYLKDTIKCLFFSKISFTPSIGCLLRYPLNSSFFSSSSALISNLNSISFLLSLNKEFYYQRKDFYNRKIGNLKVIKTKSKPAYWLQPKLLGNLVGISLHKVFFFS